MSCISLLQLFIAFWSRPSHIASLFVGSPKKYLPHSTVVQKLFLCFFNSIPLSMIKKVSSTDLFTKLTLSRMQIHHDWTTDSEDNLFYIYTNLKPDVASSSSSSCSASGGDGDMAGPTVTSCLHSHRPYYGWISDDE